MLGDQLCACVRGLCTRTYTIYNDASCMQLRKPGIPLECFDVTSECVFQTSIVRTIVTFLMDWSFRHIFANEIGPGELNCQAQPSPS